MRHNIFDILGMHDTSFHVSHNKIQERLMPLSARPSPEESLVDLVDGDSVDAMLKQPVDATDDYGGAGLFGSAEDYLKLLKSILHNDGKLLTSQSVQLMLTHSIMDASQASLQDTLPKAHLASIVISGEPAIGARGAGKWSDGLGGLIGLHESDVGFTPGWMQWVGAPNLKWWIDRGTGTCGIFATQLLPPGQEKAARLQRCSRRTL